MLPALVIDGHDRAEPEEAQLAARILQRSACFSRVVQRRGAVPAQFLSSRWSVVWIACHTTIYRGANRGSLELREGSVYRRFATDSTLRAVDTQLLVLSTCNSFGGPFRGTYRARWVVSHEGALDTDDAFVFAARFLRRLVRTMRRDRFSPEVVAEAFAAGKRSSGDPKWRFSTHASARPKD